MAYLYLVEAALWMAAAFYSGYLYITVFRHDKRKLVLRRFNNAIRQAYKRNDPPKSFEETLECLLVDYNNIVRHIGKIEYTSCLDVLEQIFYRYDTYSEKDFKAFFKEDREENIRDFVFDLCKQMKKRGPYIELPHEESKLICNLQNALADNNVALGTSAIDQLVSKIIRRDYDLQSQKNDNQLGKDLSIAGIIVSVAFGVLSIIMYLNPISP